MVPLEQGAPPDPNWLLSTTAQSAAAIVAIVGGFLVSRVVSLSSQRQALRQRRDELEELSTARKEALDLVEQSLDWRARDWFVDGAIDDYLAADGSPDIGQIAEEHAKLGSADASTLTMAEELGRIARAVLAVADRGAHLLESHKSDLEWLQSQGVPIEPGWEDAVIAVATRVAWLKRPRDPYGLARDDVSVWAGIGRTTEDPGVRRQEERLRKQEDLQAEVRALESESKILRENLARIGQPEGVITGILILTGFASVGIVLPLALLALRPVPAAWGIRTVIVVGFTLGLGAVVAYLLASLRRLKAD